MLEMSLNEIRGKIQIYPENWINISTTNCYAYALGLDVRESDICSGAYQPGMISRTFDSVMLEEFFPYCTLVRNIEEDLKALDISFREIEPNDMIEQDEWKMALFGEVYYKDSFDDLLHDFHFIRTNKNGIWTHKRGYTDCPSRKDFNDQIITDPKTCDLIMYEYKKCYALKLK